ncbi:hypothetical protein EMCRGX_G014804 [Ephydatia muelleri]|eukprot:Em0005g1197a
MDNSDSDRPKKKKKHSSTKKRGKEKEKVHKHHRDKSHKHKKKSQDSRDHGEHSQACPSVQLPLQPPAVEETQMKAPSRSFVPMTKEQFEKQQSVVTRVYDPDTGRHRLVKGTGEIIEEIVSKERQKQINKQATRNEGVSFQAGMAKLL